MPPAASAPPAHDPALMGGLHAALTDLVKAYQFRDRDRVTCHGVTVTQCYALAAIAERGPLTVNDLSAELQLDKSTASRTADALEAMKLVRRGAHPTSRRSVLLRVTVAGLALHRRIEEELIVTESERLAAFSEAELEAATAVMRQLAAWATTRVRTGCGDAC
jgi:DNA-binding MarR family transcriptional regulator